MDFNQDDYGKLIYRNHASTDFGIYVKKPWSPIHPTPDETMTHIPGRNGDLWQTTGAYQNVTETFECIVLFKPEIYDDWFQVRDAISDWLKIGAGYDYLEFSVYPDWAFYANAQPFTMTPSSTNKNQADLSLVFNCSPMMTAIRGLDWKELPTTQSINNQTDYEIHPEFHIHGNGDLVLKVNNMNYYFDDIENDIWLNSDGNAYELDSDGVRVLANEKIRLVNNDSPVFSCGVNSIVLGTPANDEGSVINTALPDGTKAWYKAKWKKVI